MTVLQAAAVLTLWHSGQFDTHDIATAVNIAESLVCKVIHAAKERERGPDLYIVGELA